MAWAVLRILNVLSGDLHVNNIFIIILNSIFLFQCFDISNDGKKAIVAKIFVLVQIKARGHNVTTSHYILLYHAHRGKNQIHLGMYWWSNKLITVIKSLPLSICIFIILFAFKNFLCGNDFRCREELQE